MATNLPPMRELLRTLIATPSVSSVNPAFDQGNREVIDHLANWCAGLGFEVEILPLPDRPGKADLIATLGSGSGGLVLAGHTDTVPWDEARWHHDPFTLTEADGRLYGLGTSDMKGFFAPALKAMRDLRTADLREPLILVATADEESSMAGAQALVDAGRPRARYAVVGEPTGLRPVRLHKGILMEGIRLVGRSGHSSDPALGASALEAMHRVIGELLEWRAALQATHRDRRFRVPFPTLNLGHIHGGDNPNRICGECELHFDLRLLPGMDPDALRTDLHARLERVLAGSGVSLELHPLFPGAPALETPAESPIVAVAERLTGHAAEAVAFATEGPYLQALGIEPVILGPGNIDQAHQPDEYLALARIEPTVDLLTRLIHRFCVEPASP
ncbi:acetylornithine deacetylase [bacterium BMS3Bbin12]|nr:acetylornithine deacetylase [bacterium BMS3Abin12]GBE48247.1 acetylornithine deacetylase [bacterium BMS3Bbin12]GBE50756.1 acetylornithine deacetylase [bacterium BMS3Bbin13]HDK02706.1 acetylornithine deacetylase [Gammaproteobacteria bacterium]